jgi:type IV pilus assembly protein PilQ
MKKILVLTLSLFLIFTASCGKKRPDMAYKSKDKVTKQDIENFDVKKSITELKKNSDQFVKDAKSFKSVTKKSSRRVSLDQPIATEASLGPKDIIDLNLPIQTLETVPITLKFDSINIRSALKLFSSIVKRNLIIGDEVTGTITVDFQDIKWGSAVYAILEMNNLVMLHDQSSGMLRVHTKKKFIELEKQKIDNTNTINQNLQSLGNESASTAPTNTATDAGNAQSEVTEETKTEIFKVFNQTSNDLVASINAVIDGMTVTNDQINNQLIITGTKQQLDRTEKLLDKIDIEKKSVMIEAFIVNAEDGFTKKFDANLEAVSDAGGNWRAGGQDGIGTMVGAANPQGNNLQVGSPSAGDDTDITAPTLQGGVFILARLGRARLGATIAASVSDTNSETISNPKIFAIDGEQATISQGTQQVRSVPASGGDAGGFETLDFTLNFGVTPTIIGDKVRLQITLANDSLGSGGTDSNTPKNTENVTSTVVLNSGDVAVLGGVYKNTKQDDIIFVPLLHRIPILGEFFKTKTKNDTKSQLLIFVTANIV